MARLNFKMGYSFFGNSFTPKLLNNAYKQYDPRCGFVPVKKIPPKSVHQIISIMTNIFI